MFNGRDGTLNQNSIIDAMDVLNKCMTADEAWVESVQMVQSLGVDSLSVAKIERQSGEFLWARSSMSQEWLGEYVSQEYYECDPFLTVFSTQANQISAIGASLGQEDGMTHQEIALNRGLWDAGYHSLHGTKFGGLNDNTGKIVTLCYEDAQNAPDTQGDMDRLAGISALISTFVRTPSMPGGAGYLDVGQTLITQREREVLTLLATGLQTARISEKLGITETTVTKHFATARQKLGAHTREQALFIAMRRGLIDL